MCKEETMTALTVRTDKTNGEADVIFDRGDDRDLLDDLHNSVIRTVDGASMKGGINDSVVAIRKKDFDDVVVRLADAYRERGFTVRIE
jgi:hypothetical protein